jgi:hypothetical protein
MPLIFFTVTGFLVPNYDDVTYYFLLDTCLITQSEYDYLNMSQSIGIIFGIALYVNFLKKTEVWKLILSSLVFNLAVNSIQFFNFTRANLAYGVSDIQVNAIIMLLGKGTQVSLSVVPMTVMMMNIIPANIEASMFAFITAILSFSDDWGGQFVGGIICKVFHIENKKLSNFGQALLLKNFLLMISILLITILPTNQQIKELGEKLNEVGSDSESISDNQS